MNRRDFQNKNNSSSSKRSNYILPASLLLIGAISLGTSYSYFSKENRNSIETEVITSQQIPTQTTTENSHNSLTNNGFINNGRVIINNFFGVEPRNQETLEERVNNPQLSTQSTRRQTNQENRVIYDFCTPPITTDLYIIDGNEHEVKECDTNREGTAGDEVFSLLRDGVTYTIDGEEFTRDKIKTLVDNRYRINKRQDTITINTLEDRLEEETVSVPVLEEDTETFYHFDITGDGIIDRISLIEKNGSMITKVEDGETLRIEHKLNDNARGSIFSALRYDNVDNSVGPASCYNITYGSQGEEVLKYLVDSNKYSNSKEITKLEELAVLIDTTANCNVRGNILVMKNDENLYNLNTTDSKAYKLTFGDNVPSSILALNLGLGSAVYSTYRSDFNPRVKGSESLKISRGGANNMNLENLTNSLKNDSLLQGTIDSYNLAKRMYSAQFRASKTKLSEEDVKF